MNSEQISLESALEIFDGWIRRFPTIAVAIGTDNGWGPAAEGIIEKRLEAPGQGIEFWALKEGAARRVNFSDAVFFQPVDLGDAPESLRSGWHSFLLLRFQDGKRLLFAERYVNDPPGTEEPPAAGV